MEHVIALTGFEPFGRFAVNPSGEIARAMHGQYIGGCRVEARVLPVARSRVMADVDALIAQHQPIAFVATGVGARCAIELERQASNLDKFDNPDTDGARPRNEKIIPDGPDRISTSFDLVTAENLMHASGVQTNVSESAGSYLCNHLYYRLLHARMMRKIAPAGVLFVHIPPIDDGPSTMTLAESTRAIQTVVGIVVAQSVK
jgi:pyroglutamyl-peptidase